jgi:hypothetical protein
MSLEYRDICNRQLNLITDSCSIPTSGINIPTLYNSLNEKYTYKKARIVLENWTSLSPDESVALNKALDVFSMILENENDSNIENTASLIEGKIIKKLRNAKQTRLLNNYKRGWIKHKHTSMLNDTDDNINAVEKAKSNGGYLGNSLHPHRKYKQDIYGRRIGEEKSKAKEQGVENNGEEEAKQEAYFDKFIAVASVNEQCDRVLHNHSKLTKRFNLEDMVAKCPLNQQSLRECVYNISELIDSYDIPFGIKYNIALENIMYLMHKNCIPVDNSLVVEAVTDYFLMGEINDDKLTDMKFIIENSKFFSDDDLEPVKYLTMTEQEEQAFIEAVENEDRISPVITENKHMHDMFLKWKRKHVQTKEQKNKADRLKIKKIIHDFKRSHKKDINKFKDAASRIFVQRPEAIVQELPDIFNFVRLGIVIGAFAIKPILGVLVLVTGAFAKMKISREQMDKVIDQYSKERDKYKKLADEAEDEKKKEKYTALYKQYKADTDTLELKAQDLYTNEENDKRLEEKWAKEMENSAGEEDLLGDFDFDFDDFDFEESVKYTTRLSALYEQFALTKAEIMNTLRNNISVVSTDDIYNITEAVKLCNDIFDCPRYINILESELNNSKSNDYAYSRSAAIKQCIKDIEAIKYDNLLETVQEDSDVKTMYDILKCKHDIMTDTLSVLTGYKNSYINEGKENSGMSFTSKLKIASENLRRFAHKAKDKDKQLSMKLDSELNRTAKAAKRAMISDSRESIIRGSFLPSASKCIHIALASGAAFLINPVLAVIGVIGYIGCSKSLTAKERNLILDDIDIEIKMCDKYLKIAEDKDDLTAVREIMKTKRDLERQRARILYNKNYIIKGKKQYDMKPNSMTSKEDED